MTFGVRGMTKPVTVIIRGHHQMSARQISELSQTLQSLIDSHINTPISNGIPTTDAGLNVFKVEYQKALHTFKRTYNVIGDEFIMSMMLGLSNQLSNIKI